MIEFRSASVVVPVDAGTSTILQPTTLALTEQRISIIGSNGSGKSTLARLINGLIEPSAGSVQIMPGAVASMGAVMSGVDPHPAPTPLDTVRDGAAVRRAVGFVFTNPDAQLIMPTVVEDVELSLRRSHPDKKLRREAARTALDRFGIAHLADRSAHTLSGGQKQLLAITSVLAAGPSILVADEPTTLLDLQNSLMIGEVLMSLPQQLIVVTHDLELAARADRTLVIDNGKVTFDGLPSSAVAHYRDLVGRPPSAGASA